MSQTSTSVVKGTAVRSPIDGLITAIATRIGGGKAREVERFLKFAVVGTVGAVIDSGSLAIMQATILPPTLQTPDWNVALAESISFVLAITSNFTWNRYWTYPDSRSRAWHIQISQFALISLIGWSLRTVWITAAHVAIGHALMPLALPIIQMIKHGYTPSPTAEAKLGTMVAWLIGVFVVMMWNFLANRLWTYNDVE